jgi:hypothetical protein
MDNDNKNTLAEAACLLSHCQMGMFDDLDGTQENVHVVQ